MGPTDAAVLRTSPQARAGRADWLTSARLLAPALVVGLAYYGGSLAGFWLRFPGSGISFFWPPTAVLTAALLSTTSRLWWQLIAGAFVAHAIAHIQDGVPLGSWLVQFMGNGSQALIAALVVLRYAGGDPFLTSLRSVITFIIGACVVAPAVASLIPASVYVSLGWAPSLRDAWLTRTVTNVVASLTLIPSLAVVWRFLFARPINLPDRLGEFWLLLLGVTAIYGATGYFARDDMFGLSVALFAPTPFLLWAIIRFGVPGLSFALLWTTLLTVGAANAGHPSFVADTTARTVLGVQIFIAGNAILTLLIASLMEAQRAEHARLVAIGVENTAIMERLREAQQRYALATAAGGVGVWEVNLQTGEAYLERNLKGLLGYAEGEIEDSIDSWLSMIWPADRQEVQAHLEAFSRGIVDSFDLECRMRHRDGSLRWIAAKGAVTDRVDGTPVRVRGTYTDVTPRKESERALRDAADTLARTSRISAMTELSASLAHELNQPLTAIVANVNACVRWIDAGAPMGEVSEALRDVLHESQRASQIVARTRGLFANRPNEPVRLNLNDVVHDVIELALPRLRESHVVLDVHLSSDSVDVVADPVQMQQVFVNLIVNASEAMRDVPADLRRLRIRTGRGRDEVIVDVRDSGRGFLPDDRQRLFEPFYTTKPGGTGMGLAICRSIMEHHDGQLRALVNAGPGATFRIRMPAVSGSDASPDALEA